MPGRQILQTSVAAAWSSDKSSLLQPSVRCQGGAVSTEPSSTLRVFRCGFQDLAAGIIETLTSTGKARDALASRAARGPHLRRLRPLPPSMPGRWPLPLAASQRPSSPGQTNLVSIRV